VTDRYPEGEPYQRGWLDAGDGNAVYWEICGNPHGKPALAVHGGPGSGASPWWRTLFDPGAYRAVLFDQRGCGRSRPHASDPNTDLTENTTLHLIEDMERLRQQLGIDQWLLLGGSWGSALALAYAEAHPKRVSEMILFGVTTGRRKEFDWLFRGGVAIFFPEQWERLREAVPVTAREGDVVEQYFRLLNDHDSAVRQRAAESWCRWESATLDWPPKTELDARFTDPRYAMAFARLVTHYVRHNAWIEDGTLLRHADKLAGIPGILVNGRLDFQAPVSNAWELRRVWPRADLVVVEDAGHGPNAALGRELVRATDRFASLR
jgi:proline iminopeptidase